jgi:hypothetical protein
LPDETTGKSSNSSFYELCSSFYIFYTIFCSGFEMLTGSGISSIGMTENLAG